MWRIYLDTNVFIAAFERKDALGLRIGSLFNIWEPSKQQSFVTSELTMSELLVAPYRSGDDELSQAYVMMMTSNEWLQVASVTRPVLKRAAWLRSLAPSLKLPDAIHVATALEIGCSHFLTDDLGILKLQPGSDNGLTFLRPDKPTLDILTESLSA